jgi:glycosyltransferase involved in cell wall biosynthesis
MANFNREAFIAIAIESVRRQTWTDWELLIVDDGSTDDSFSIAQRLASQDQRIRVHRQSNAGQARARNVGIAGTHAPLVCFIDSDDVWTPTKLERQVAIMEDASIDVLYGEEDLIDEKGHPVAEAKMTRHAGSIWRALLVDNFITFSTTMVRRAALDRVGGFDAEIRRADDYDLWLRLSVFANFQYRPELWGFYRVGAQQISRDKTGRFASNERILRRFLDGNPSLAGPEVVNSTWCRFYARQARSLARWARGRPSPTSRPPS